MLMVPLLALSSVAGTFLDSRPAMAANPANGKPLEWQVQSNWYLQAMTGCMKSPGWSLTRPMAGWNLSENDVKSGNWFKTAINSDDGRSDAKGFYMRDVLKDIGDDGGMSCASNDNELIKKSLAFWGLDALDLMCSSGIVVRDNGTECSSHGNGSFKLKDGDSKVQDQLRQYVLDKVYSGQAPQLTDAMQYVLYKQTFLKGCAYGAKPLDQKPSGSQVYEISKFTLAPAAQPDQTPTITAGSEFYIGDKSPNTNRWLWTNPDSEKNCDDLASAIAPGSAYASAYQNSLRTPGASTKPDKGQCSDGPSSNPCPAPGDKSSCQVPGLGWIVCPVITFLASIMDNVYGFLADNFLRTDIKLVDTTSPTYGAWAKMRDLSNVVLAIVFLIMIFSQLTSAGISNYGLKKMFPRLVIAAILVNVSFFACQIMVDLSNILGASMQGFFQSLGPQVHLDQVTSTTDVANASSALGVSGIALSVLAGAGVLYLVLPFLGAMILAGLVAVLLIGFLLIARKALIVLLIVIAPLALAAYMLPNTEQWFKKWQKMFLSLLLLYPVIAVVFGASQLASHILAPVGDAAGDNLLKVVAAATAVLPLFIVPSLLKGSLNAIGNLGSGINKIGGKFQGWAGKKGGEVQTKGLGKLASSRFGKNSFVRRIGGRATGQGRRAFDALGARSENETSQQIIDGWARSGDLFKTENLQAIAAKNPSSAEGQAALRQLAATGSAVELANIRKGITSDKDMAAFNRSIASQFGALKAKHPGAVMPMTPEKWGEVKQADMHAMKDAAIEEGASSSPAFRANLEAALADPEQGRHFTPNIHNTYGSGQSSAGSARTETRSQESASNPFDDANLPSGQPSVPSGARPEETPSQRSAREAVQRHTEQSGEADEWARWRQQQQAREVGGNHTDEQGRQTPNGADDDYQDRMNH